MAANKYGDGVAWIRGSMIEKGSYGRVYHATLKNPASKYSCYPPEMAVKSAEVSSSSSIQKEAEVLTALQGCPNVIEFYGTETTVGPTGVMAYNLLLEYASGRTLADRIKKSGGNGLAEFEAKAYARSILRGLVRVHGLGYVHCDLKPDNILLVEEFDGVIRAKIGDLGLAKKVGRSEPRPSLRGTLRYLSPEAVLDYVQETPCDVWALGCVVLEMLTGKTLIDQQRCDTDRPNNVSEDARGFLDRCFVVDPTRRWSAEMLLRHEFLEGLENEDEDEDEDEESMSCDSSMDEWSYGDEESSFSGEDDEGIYG